MGSQREWGLVFTNRRIIMVLKKKASYAGALGGALFGFGGGAGVAVLADALAKRKPVDFDPAALAAVGADPANVSIPYERIQVIRLRKGRLGAFNVALEYADTRNKRRSVQVAIDPSQVAWNWQENKRLEAEHARSTRDRIITALPPGTPVQDESGL